MKTLNYNKPVQLSMFDLTSIRSLKMEDENFNKIVALMHRSEMDARAQEHLRVFLFSLMETDMYSWIWCGR